LGVAQGSQYDPDPYRPPAFDDGPKLEPAADGTRVLATRGQRFGAAFLDRLIGRLVLLAFQYALGVHTGFPRARLLLLAFPQVRWGLGAMLVYLALNGYLLAQSGQTIGKRLLGIRIVNFADGSPTPLVRILALRIWPFQLVPFIPIVGPFASLIDALAIFREDHRCLHDHVAGTMVVKVSRPG
jgi:uncharacterized RDD family membrane protein YckC